jgi:hypothetical protein
VGNVYYSEQGAQFGDAEAAGIEGLWKQWAASSEAAAGAKAAP